MAILGWCWDHILGTMMKTLLHGSLQLHLVELNHSQAYLRANLIVDALDLGVAERGSKVTKPKF